MLMVFLWVDKGRCQAKILFGNYAHIAPGVTLSGNVTVGNKCMIGVGSTIIQGIKIVADCFLGAGSVVTKNITEKGVYVGISARRMKK